jgi:hypothetical protein
MLRTATMGRLRREPIPMIPSPDTRLIDLLDRTQTTSGRNLLSLVDEKPMLLVFLRHFGCGFTRETLHDVSKAKAALDMRGVRPVFVHMTTPERAERFFRRFGLQGVLHVSDPETRLYQAPEFHLLKASALQHFFGARAYIKTAKRVLFRYGVGRPVNEDPEQLPGVFFLKNRMIHRAFRHKALGDRPDYGIFGV